MAVTRSSRPSHWAPILRAVTRRLLTGILILLIIAFLTFIGLILAERGQAGLPARLLDASGEAFRRTLEYVFNHPAAYTWSRQSVAALPLVMSLLGRSAGLLLLSLLIAAGIGVPAGIWITVRGHRRLSSLALPLSVLGISTPSFLLAMLLWIANIQLGKWFGGGKAPLPSLGFGWDEHMLMPALVLAMRPLAQLVQITHLSLAEVLGSDYVRTAHAKGLSRFRVINRHALRNVWIPVLTALSISLRYSLAALPVVEVFFGWPGAGNALLRAIQEPLPMLAADLVVGIGLLFLFINGLLDIAYQLIDPRVRDDARGQSLEAGGPTLRERWQELRQFLATVPAGLATSARRRLSFTGGGAGKSAPTGAARVGSAAGQVAVAREEAPDLREQAGRRRAFTAGITNPALLVGGLLVLLLAATVIWGEGWTAGDAYTTHGVMKVEGKITAPPFAPSPTYPWGSDAVGRDIQALVLTGAKTTLTLAVLAMLARVLLGAVLGLQAGWWRGGWLDRLIQGAGSVWAAFPVTLFAMILILAMGIKQGIGVFVVALCLVGWAEIAQFVRAQVIALKPQPYVEGARAVGARSSWMLSRHIFPHLWAPLLVTAALEMASVLMLLADLGFLNIFVGGGFRADIGQTGRAAPVIYYFSDVPEWSALLSNIRNWWRSYPWLAWYPGVAFFLAILTFNLLGEGLKRFLDESRLNIGRVINRYTVVAAVVVVVGAAWSLRSTTDLPLYAQEVDHFDPQRALADVKMLTSPQVQGRESGTPGARVAADYIAGEMARIGLQPAGDRETYISSLVAPRVHLTGVPRLEIVNPDTGETIESFAYRQGFVEYADYWLDRAEGRGSVAALALGPESTEVGKKYIQGLLDLPLDGHVLLMLEADYERIMAEVAGSGSADRIAREIAGFLIVTGDPGALERKYLYRQSGYSTLPGVPALMVTPETANRLLAGTGLQVAELAELSASLDAGQSQLSNPGQTVFVDIPRAPDDFEEAYLHVIGFIPGTDAQGGLDSHVVMISAYYDGLGVGPEGVLYQGANDNASGVAALLEIARAMKESVQPRRTVVFVAWSGGERAEGLSVTNTMGAKLGFNQLTVDSVIELSGMGAGTGNGIALGQGTAFKLVQLFQSAGRELGTPVTTRGRGPHFDIETAPGYGVRSALSAYVSWDGSDQNVHTRLDSYEAIDPEKLRRSGQISLLAVTVLSQSRQ